MRTSLFILRRVLGGNGSVVLPFQRKHITGKDIFSKTRALSAGYSSITPFFGKPVTGKPIHAGVVVTPQDNENTLRASPLILRRVLGGISSVVTPFQRKHVANGAVFSKTSPGWDWLRGNSVSTQTRSRQGRFF